MLAEYLSVLLIKLCLVHRDSCLKKTFYVINKYKLIDEFAIFIFYMLFMFELFISLVTYYLQISFSVG